MMLPPQIPDSEWLESVSPTTLRESKALAPAATDVVWDAPFFRGAVADGGSLFRVALDLRSRTFPRAECSCETGRSRRVCRHALAVYFAYFAPLLAAAEAARRAAEKPFGKETREPRPPLSDAAKSAFPRPASAEHFSAGKIFAGTAPAESAAPAQGNFRAEIDGGSAWLSVVLPSPDAPFRAALRDLLKNSGFALDARSRRWFLRGEHETLNFLAAHRDFLEKDCRAAFSPAFRKFLRGLRTAEIRCGTFPRGDGGFDFEARLDAGGVPEAEIACAAARGRRYVRGKNGVVVLLPPERLRKISALRERLGRGENFATENAFRRRLSAAELASAEDALSEIGVAFTPPETWRERSAALRDLSRLARPPVPEALFSRLRAYQQIGAAWLWHLHENGLGGILADEMGLGKTVQAIAFFAALFSEESSAETRDSRALLVVPAALTENWRRELARFAPEIPVRVHHGQKRARDAFASFPRGVVLTSYATLAADVELFGACAWRVIVADEAQQIKNRRSRNARSLKFLRADTRFVLTGTPIENSLEDLRSLFEFILPGFLPPTGTAHGAGMVERRERERENLRRLAAPYILRRTKSAVAPELPPRIEQTLWCRFGDAQARLYAEWKTRSREEFFKLEMAGASDARLRAATFSQLLRLRQICTEPRVVSPDFPEAENAKLRAFRELLDEARAGGHRMLVFSQFVSVLDFLADALEADGVPFCRIDGSTRERARECDRFNASPEIPVFLISLKAGGVGLNITGADVVVHYDPWWNPAAEAQATDRAHRIGQTRAVTSVKLAVADSVEERVLFLQREKRRLLEELFEASAAENAKISLAEMRELLK